MVIYPVLSLSPPVPAERDGSWERLTAEIDAAAF